MSGQLKVGKWALTDYGRTPTNDLRVSMMQTLPVTVDVEEYRHNVRQWSCDLLQVALDHLYVLDERSESRCVAKVYRPVIVADA